MAVKALIFGVDELYNELKPFYEMAVQRGNIEIVGFAELQQNSIKLYGKGGGYGSSQL